MAPGITGHAKAEG